MVQAILRVDPIFWKDFALQGNQQEVMKVVSLCKNGRKDGGVPIHPNYQIIRTLDKRGY